MLWSKEPDLQDFYSKFLSDANGEKTNGTLPSSVAEWISQEILRKDPAARGWGYRLDSESPSIPGMFHCHVFVHRPGFVEERARIREMLHPDTWHKLITQPKRLKVAVHTIDAAHFMSKDIGNGSVARSTSGFGLHGIEEEKEEEEECDIDLPSLLTGLAPDLLASIAKLSTTARQLSLLKLIPPSTLVKVEHLEGGLSLADVLLVTCTISKGGESTEQTSVVKIARTNNLLLEYQNGMMLSSFFPEKTGLARPLRPPASHADCSAVEIEFISGRSAFALFQETTGNTSPAFRAALRDSFGPGGIIFELRRNTAQRGHADPNEKNLEHTASVAPEYFSEELLAGYEDVSSMPLHDLISVGHNDLHADNLMVRDEDSAVFLIDCVLAGYGPMLNDHAAMLCKFLLQPDLITTDAQFESTKELLTLLFPVKFRESDLDVHTLPNVAYKESWEFPVLNKMASMALQLLSYVGPLISAAGGEPSDHHPKYLYATLLHVATEMASYKQGDTYDGRLTMHLCSRLIAALRIFHSPDAHVAEGLDEDGYARPQGMDLSNVTQLRSHGQKASVPMHNREAFEAWYKLNLKVIAAPPPDKLAFLRQQFTISGNSSGSYKLQLRASGVDRLVPKEETRAGPLSKDDVGGAVIATVEMFGGVKGGVLGLVGSSGISNSVVDRDLTGTLRYFDGRSKCGIELHTEAPDKMKTRVNNGKPHFKCTGKDGKGKPIQDAAVYLESSKVKVRPTFSNPVMCYKIEDNIRNTINGHADRMKVCKIIGITANGHYEVQYHNDANRTSLILCVGDHYRVPTASYDTNQQIMLFANNSWDEYHVKKALGGSKYALSADVAGFKITCDLNPANHFVYRMGKKEYAAVLDTFLKQCIEDNVYVPDGITKAMLHIGEQLVSIGLDEVKEEVKDEGGGGSAAEELKFEQDGKFLIRSKPASTTDFVLSIVYRGRPTHHVLSADGGGAEFKLVKQSTGTTTLVDFIEKYRTKQPKWPVPLTDGVPSPDATSAVGKTPYFHGRINKAATEALLSTNGMSAINETVNDEPYVAVKDVFELCKVLVADSPENRKSGIHFAQPLLVKAGAGTGKTWLTKQLLYAVSRTADVDIHSRYVPFLLPVQRLAFEMRRFQSKNPDTPLAEAIKPNLLEWYIEEVYGTDSPQTRNLLLDAFDSKRLMLILDGIDEAADLKSEVQDLIQNILIPCQIRFMATSRPEGLRESLYRRGFVVLTLKPYTKEQQDQVLSKQLEGQARVFVDNVRNFSEAFRTLDEIYNTHRGDLDSVEAIRPFDLTYEKSKGVFSKYAQQVMPGGVPAATVEQLHLAAAEAKPIFDQELMAIAEKLGMAVSYSTDDMIERGTGLILVVEKRKDRSRTKCIAKYQPEVEAGRRPPPAASWATDVVRSSFVCNNIRQILQLLAMIRDNPLFTIVRLKNLFLALDPTHFRRIMLTIRIQLNRVDNTQYWHNAEVQIHHREIFKLKMTNEKIMHTPYEYFRELFGAQMTKQLDAKAGWLSIESRMRLWRDILEVPVLMSLFILLLRDITKGGFDKSKLPNNEVDLYQTSIGIMIKEVSKNADEFQVIYDTLRRVAYANHLYGRREFTSDHLRTGLFRQYEVDLNVVPSPSNESKIINGKYKIDKLCQTPGDNDFGKVVIRLRDDSAIRASLLHRTENVMTLEKVAKTSTFYIRHKATGKYLSFKKSDFNAKKYHASYLYFLDKGDSAVKFKRVHTEKGVTGKLDNAAITVSELECVLVPGSRLQPSSGTGYACLGSRENVNKETMRWSALELNESPGDVFLLNHTFDSGEKYLKGNRIKFTSTACKTFERYGFVQGQFYKIVHGPDSDNDIKVEYMDAAGTQTRVTGYIKATAENLKPKTRDQYNETTSALLFRGSSGEAKIDRTNEMQGNAYKFNIMLVGSALQTVSSSSIVPDAPSNANNTLWTAFEPVLSKPGEDTLRIPTLKILDDVADKSSGAVLNFQSVHLSLQEFLCADYLAEQVVTNRARAAMGREMEFMDWDYNSLVGVKALFEEPRHKNMVKFLGQLGVADQMLQFPGEVEDPKTRTWDAETGVLIFTKWKLSSPATESMITFTAGSVLAGRATKLVLTGCSTPGATEEIMLALSRFGFLEELDMRGSTSKTGFTNDGDEKINDWQLTWNEMVTEVRDAHHPTLKRVLLQNNVGALIRSNPTLFPIEQIKQKPDESTIELVNDIPALGLTGDSPPKWVRRRLTHADNDRYCVAHGSYGNHDYRNTEHDGSFNGEYSWSRGWEVPVISGKCIITFVERNPPPLVTSAFDHHKWRCDHVGTCGCSEINPMWRFFGVCSSLKLS